MGPRFVQRGKQSPLRGAGSEECASMGPRSFDEPRESPLAPLT